MHCVSFRRAHVKVLMNPDVQFAAVRITWLCFITLHDLGGFYILWYVFFAKWVSVFIPAVVNNLFQSLKDAN